MFRAYELLAQPLSIYCYISLAQIQVVGPGGYCRSLARLCDSNLIVILRVCKDPEMYWEEEPEAAQH